MILEQLHEYLVPEEEMGYQTVSQTEIPVTGEKETTQTDRRIHSSGVFEMSLGNGGESGKSYFSDEIMHGLGNGPVCVEIGIEYISRDNLIQGDRESIILGDGSILLRIPPLQMTRSYQWIRQSRSFLTEVPSSLVSGRKSRSARWGFVSAGTHTSRRIWNRESITRRNRRAAL